MVGWFEDQGKKGVCIGKKVGRGEGGRDRLIFESCDISFSNVCIPQTQLVRFA